MRGIILAGGKGTRIFPNTAVTNKHLVPVGSLPMIEYPLYTLSQMGIKDINIVTGGEHFRDIAGYLSQTHPNLKPAYHYQEEAGGIAQALSLVKNFVGNEKMAVVLGDNIIQGDFSKQAKAFEKSDLGAMLFLKQVSDPERSGVAEMKDNKIIRIVEKPKKPPSNYVAIGLYLYDQTVFDKIKKLKPSVRGQLEITDVSNSYIREGRLDYQILDGFWGDAGTVKSRQDAGIFVQKSGLEKEVIKSLCSNPQVAKNLKGAFGDVYPDIFE
jgi:glucose-1-phosphate thymidylyltransferase